MDKKRFADLALSPELLRAVEKMGFEEATPIQSLTIPVLLEGRDVVGQSQTGSGKTAAFALPAIERVDPALRAPQVLVLCPTRELAVQVAEEFARLAIFKKGVRELPIYGGQSYERQFRGLQQGAQIIIGTPGRVMDHLDRGSLKLDQIRMVILDEADRMLDMGFIDDIRTILQKAPPERQTVLFSATVPRPIQELIKTFTRDPQSLRIEAQALSAPDIEQVYYEVDWRGKLEVLCRIIDLQDVRFGLIFCATKRMVDELTEHLVARGYAADKLHGDMSQALRERVMGRFRKRAIEFLVATDVAARGLDIDDIEVVFNYDLPNDGEDYVHRIGRTGRAGKSGRAVTFVAGREIYKLQQILRMTRGKIRRERVPSAEEVEEKRRNVFYEDLRETLEKGTYRRHDALIDRLLDQNHSPTDIASALIHLLTGGDATPGPDVPPPKASTAPKPADTAGALPKRERAAPADRPSAPRPAASAQSHPVRHDARREDGPRDTVRLLLNVGREHNISPGDILGVVLGVTRASREAVGRIQLLDRRSLVEVDASLVRPALKQLNGVMFKGRKLRCEAVPDGV
jgi:ATP-dependent RNA helicase DeaD